MKTRSDETNVRTNSSRLLLYLCAECTLDIASLFSHSSGAGSWNGKTLINILLVRINEFVINFKQCLNEHNRAWNWSVETRETLDDGNSGTSILRISYNIYKWRVTFNIAWIYRSFNCRIYGQKLTSSSLAQYYRSWIVRNNWGMNPSLVVERSI